MTKYKINFSLTILLFLFLSKQLVASPQVPDYIIYENDTIPTYNLILEKYLQKKNPNSEKLFGLSFGSLIPLEEDEEDFGMAVTVSCWRGYQAIYKIENDSLFLSDIIVCHSIRNIDKELSNKNMYALFGSRVKNNKVFIDWFRGNISFPTKSKDKQNEIIRWDGVFEIIFLFETLVKIDKGKIKSIKEIENYVDDPNKINRKENDTISNVLFDKIQNYKKELEEDKYRVRINKKGKIDRVELDLTKEEKKEYYLLIEKIIAFRCWTRSIKKALKGLEFDVIKRKGKPIEEYVYIEIWL